MDFLFLSFRHGEKERDGGREVKVRQREEWPVRQIKDEKGL